MKKNFLITFCVALFLVGCGKSSIQIPNFDNSISGESGAYGEVIAASEGRFNPVYFEFDKSRISPNANLAITYNADFLKTNTARIVIEGNAHEWGGSEYNFALGLRRATAVKEALVAAGVAANRLQVASNGNANPVCEVDDSPRCQIVNRRVDLVVLP